MNLTSKRVNPEQISEKQNHVGSSFKHNAYNCNYEKSTVFLHKSLFPHRPPTIFFEDYSNNSPCRDDSSKIPLAETDVHNYDRTVMNKHDSVPTILFQCSVERQCIRQVLHRAGMQRVCCKNGIGAFLHRKIWNKGERNLDPMKHCSLLWMNHLTEKSYSFYKNGNLPTIFLIPGALVGKID